MNANFTRNPTPLETALATVVSDTARKLVAAYAGEVSDSREWPNEDNVYNTRTHLLAYISGLEMKAVQTMPPKPVQAKAENGHGIKNDGGTDR